MSKNFHFSFEWENIWKIKIEINWKQLNVEESSVEEINNKPSKEFMEEENLEKIEIEQENSNEEKINEDKTWEDLNSKKEFFGRNIFLLMISLLIATFICSFQFVSGNFPNEIWNSFLHLFLTTIKVLTCIYLMPIVLILISKLEDKFNFNFILFLIILIVTTPLVIFLFFYILASEIKTISFLLSSIFIITLYFVLVEYDFLKIYLFKKSEEVENDGWNSGCNASFKNIWR